MDNHILCRGSFSQLKLLLADYSEVGIVTDTNLLRHYGDHLQHIGETKTRFHLHTVNPGESSKSLAQVEQICEQLLEKGFTRKCCLVAFGGGVVGDLTGFAASMYHRGVDLIQVPTSLLAMVDSSTGGKTGVDTAFGKNTLGSFYTASKVLVDPDLLATLPDVEYSNGMAEVIKMALTSSKPLQQLIQNHTRLSLRQHHADEEQMIRLSISVKLAVVKGDPVESLDQSGTSQSREVLNFGHTIGHAIESLTMEKHGFCVAIGMARETRFIRGNLKTPFVCQKTLLDLLRNYHLPSTLPTLSFPKVCALFSRDKKGGKMVTLKGLQDPVTVTPTDKEIREMLTPQREIVYKPIDNQKVPMVITPPGSKSVSNRVLLLAALGKGNCFLRGLLLSDDTLYLIQALQNLGVEIEIVDPHQGNLWVKGTGGLLRASGNTLFLGNSGTSVRFLTAVCSTCLVAGERDFIRIDGDPRMRQRPIADLISALEANGTSFRSRDFPIEIEAGSQLRGGLIKISGKTSSQFATGVLLSMPFARSPITLEVSHDSVSKSFISLTASLMQDFGIPVTCRENPVYGDLYYTIGSLGTYQNPSDYQIEVDATSCFYPMALSALTNQPIYLKNLTSECKQGDAELVNRYWKRVGVKITTNSEGTLFQPEKLHTVQSIVKQWDLDSSDITISVAVLACLTQGHQTIQNVANQDQKECHRLQAITRALSRIGVDINLSTDSVLDIKGEKGGWWQSVGAEKPVLLECEDDHRMAMSLALLGVCRSHLVLDNVECVAKTYPYFWEMAQQFGVCTEPVSQPRPFHYWQEKSESPMVLVGLPGTGKTTLAQKLQETLDIPWVDTDHRLQQILGEPDLTKYISRNTESAFRQAEFLLLRELLLGNEDIGVISTGGGIVTDKRCQQLLSYLPCVVYLERESDDPLIQTEMQAKAELLGMNPVDFFQSRHRLYQTVMTHRLVLSPSGQVDSRWVSWCKSLVTPTPVAPHSLFLCLSCSTREELDSYLKECRGEGKKKRNPFAGCSAVECRADLLQDQSLRGVKQYLNTLIWKLQIPIPIIFTYRSQEEGGGTTDIPALPRNDPQVLALYNQAISMGCSFIDWELSGRRRSPKLRHVEAIGSVHGDQVESVAEALSSGWGFYRHLFDRGHGWRSKLVLSPEVLASVKSLQTLVKTSPDDQTLVITKGGGPEGVLSRCCNSALSPVAPLDGRGTYPHQLTVQKVVDLKRILLEETPQVGKYYLFGSPIQKSPSPQIHNQYFQEQCRLCHYRLCETTQVTRVIEVLEQAETQGASVTMPLKEQLLGHLDELSDHAQAIGAVNTLIRRAGGGWRGDNTDWLGVQELLLEGGGESLSAGSGVVVGTGGVARACCYALQQLGISFTVVGRNQTKAAALAQEFGADGSSTDLTLKGYGDLQYLLVCIPPEIMIQWDPNFLQGITDSAHIVTIIEQGYGDNLKRRYPSGSRVVVHSGYDVLCRQAKWQNQMWSIIRETV